jgi:hypothetical protein
MITGSLGSRLRRWGGAAWLAVLALPVAGCENALLEFKDPDIITNAESASGALALRNGVIQRLNGATSGGEGLWFFGGLVTDEWRSGDTFEQRNTSDQRSILTTNSFLDDQLLALNRVRIQGEQAIASLRKYSPTPTSNIGLMFAATAYAINLEGEHYCNGIPFGEFVDGVATDGAPVTVDSAFKRALAAGDSALKYIDGTEGPRVRDLANVVRGRALLNLGRYSDAATAVAGVATTFSYTMTHSSNTTTNQIWALNTGAKRYVVGDMEGGNGLNFRTANDPRLPTEAGGNAFDSQTPYVGQLKYGQFDAVPIATGIEARMIEAEVALRNTDVGTWLAKLNAARATVTSLAPLTDPGSATARVDLMFRERAFWFFATGHRMGDFRRMIRQYSRGAETVFPTGAFGKGGNYGTDINVPISNEELNNPIFAEAMAKVGPDATCLDRNQ